jgi:hypothetical protein
MTLEWQDLLRQSGWVTPWKDLTVCSTALDAGDPDDMSLDFHGNTIKRVSRKEGFRALGCQITFDNRNDKELVARFRAAWATFNKFAPILCCKAIPIARRLHVLDRVVPQALLWCGGSLNLRKDQLTALRGVQLKMIRKMLRACRPPEEQIADFMERTNRTMKCLRLRHGIRSWDQTYAALVCAWGGWIARLKELDPDRLTLAVLQYKNWQWISNIAAQNGGRQLHGRILRTWRWERALYKHVGADWMDQAMDPDSWKSQIPLFATRRLLNL